MERLPSDQELLDLHQIVQANTPVSTLLTTQRQLQEMLSRASGNTVKLPTPFDQNLLDVGMTLADFMSLRENEYNMFSFFFLRETHKLDPYMNDIPTNEELEEQFYDDIDTPNIPDHYKFGIVRWWRQLRREGQTMARLMAVGNFSPEVARQQLILSQETIGRRRVSGITLKFKYSLELQDETSEQLEEITKTEPVEPLDDAQLTQLHGQYLEALSTIRSETAVDFEFFSSQSLAEDKFEAEMERRVSKSEVHHKLAEVASRLGKAFGLSRFELSIFDLYFSTQSIQHFFWNEIVDDKTRAQYSDRMTNPSLHINQQVEEMIMQLLLKRSDLEEAEYRVRTNAIIEAGINLAGAFFAEEFDLTRTQELISGCYKKINKDVK